MVTTVIHDRTSIPQPGAIRERCDRGITERRARHERAIEQTLTWARTAAAEGALGDALAWLRVVEVVDGALPPGWEPIKQLWAVMAGAQHADASARGGPDPSRGAIGAAA